MPKPYPAVFYPWEVVDITEVSPFLRSDETLRSLVRDTTPRLADALESRCEELHVPWAGRVFLREVCAFRWSYWQELETSLESNVFPSVPTEASNSLNLERRYLLFLCWSRRPNEASKAGSERDLRMDALRAGHPWIPLLIEFERLGARVRTGHFVANVSALEALLVQIRSYSAYWTMRVELLLATTLQALGRYEACAKVLSDTQRLLARFPSAALQSTQTRRRISLAFESERYDEARALLPDALSFARNENLHTEYAFLLQEQLRAFITEGNDAAVDETFLEMERCVRDADLPQALLSLVEERCERALRQVDADGEALASLKEHVNAARERGEVVGVCLGLMFEARALRLSGHVDAAATKIDEALAMARMQSYGKARVRLLFYASALALERGKGVQARLFLAEAGLLAEECGLRVQSLCHRFASENMDADRPNVLPLLEALSSLAAFGEVFHYLKFYGFFAGWRARLGFGLVAAEWMPLEVWLANLRRVHVLHWMPIEKALHYHPAKGAPRLLRLDTSQPVEAAIALVFARGSVGASPEEIHALSYRNVRFRAETHGARVRMIVSRARARLAPLGCTLVSQREEALGVGAGSRYVVRSVAPLVAVEFVPDSAGASRLSAKEALVLALIAEQGSLATSDICERLGVTRQTVHPWLKRLVHLGLVRLKRRGPASRYVLGALG
jgi:uncharacterized membrane protein